MECGQGGEVIRLATLLNAICVPPPSFVFPHLLSFQIQEVDFKEHFTDLWQIPSETPCKYVYIVCMGVCAFM